MKTIILHKTDFTSYALGLGIWDDLLEDAGLPSGVIELELHVTAIRKASS